MSIQEFIVILSFMVVSTGVSIFITKPETVNELLVGQWFMVAGIIICAILFKLIEKAFEK